MGITTQEFTSAGLTAMYPSHYREMQILNFTCEDIVITEYSGEQFIREKSTQTADESAQSVVIEVRCGDGMRIDKDSPIQMRESKQLQLKAKRLNIPLMDFRQAPVRIDECNCIISTLDQAVIAKKMMCDYNFGMYIQETPVDTLLTDPRFVFQVIDPNDEWDMLLVNVFGQTVVLRSGRFNKLTGSSNFRFGLPETGRLICYLRYPTGAFSGSKQRQVVFDIELKDLHKKEPFYLSSGDCICVAEDMESLAEVLKKKMDGVNGARATGNLSDKMIPKEVYETEVENHKAEIERLKTLHRNQLEAANATKNAEISKLKQDLVDAQHKVEAAEAMAKSWEQTNTVRTSYEEQRFKVEAAAERARKEATEAARNDIDQMWAILKIGGVVLSGVMSFALTMLVKTGGKK